MMIKPKLAQFQQPRSSRLVIHSPAAQILRARCLVRNKILIIAVFCAAFAAILPQMSFAQIKTAPNQPSTLPLQIPGNLAGGPDAWTSPEGLSSTLQVMLLLTVLSMAPAVVLMTTCFVRMIVVLGLLRQAMGTQQLPPGQVLTSIAMFLTLLVMTPVWKQSYDNAIVPYTQKQIGLEEAFKRGMAPIRHYMSLQIEKGGNRDDIWMFYKYAPPTSTSANPTTYEDVPLQVLLPAYLLSELKIAFLIGFKIYLPFLVLDIVIATVTISMGMMMLPPVLISLPFKLLLFVLVDGWHLVVEMLLTSVQPFS
jgi:flagellar biosynthetic protein FliP